MVSAGGAVFSTRTLLRAKMGSVPSLVADLRAELAPERVRAEPLELSLYGHDASIVTGGHAAVVCFPLSTEEVQSCVRIARAHGRPFTTRGAGTGLAGGAVPLGEPVVVVTTKMNRILSIDPEERVAWVEPGVINLDLTRALSEYGLHFAPDPSSQQACSIGGNVANNSGGPHCLAYGVTSAHVLAIEVVLPDGELTVLGGLDPEPDGYDLRGVFVASEGTLGVATRIAASRSRLLPARHRRSPYAAGRGTAQGRSHRRVLRASGAQRVPCRRREPAPAPRLRRAGAGGARAGARRRRRDRDRLGRGGRSAVG